MKKSHRFKIGDKVDFKRESWPSSTKERIRGALIIEVIECEVVPGVEDFVTSFLSRPTVFQSREGGVKFYYKIQLPNYEYSLSSRDKEPIPECVAHDFISKSKDQYSIEELLTHRFSAFRLTGEFLRRKTNEQKNQADRKASRLSLVK